MPYIRGYSGQSSIYVDGVRNTTSQSRDMFAIEQVEVIKGSSSALGGGGSVGGSINLIPKVAHEGDVYQGSVQGGTDNYRHIQTRCQQRLWQRSCWSCCYYGSRK